MIEFKYVLAVIWGLAGIITLLCDEVPKVSFAVTVMILECYILSS